ncbi:MAG: hypothetical protein M4579_007289, partial [Chaenotheca gracillima]
PLKNRKARQKALQEKFDFTCLCHLCSLPLEQSQESDRRLEEIHRLDDVIDQLGTEGILVRLYNEQGREDVGFAQAFVNAAQLVIANSDLARGRIFAERAASVWKTTLGGDSTPAIKHGALAESQRSGRQKWMKPRKDSNRATSKTGFGGGRSQKPWDSWRICGAGRHSPDENDADQEFYERSNIGTYRPRRHWCFFGEIVDFASLLRLQMEIKDIDGTTIPLYFYTDSRGSELAPGQVQKGYTVAILYAERHAFMFCEPGIRHEDPQTIKVL